MEFHMINIMYAALSRNRNRKDDILMQRRLYIDEAHTVLDIFRFAAFFWYKLQNRLKITIKARMF